MLYYTETPIDTSSTAHYRSFLRAALKKGKKDAEVDRSGSMASRSIA